MARLISPPVDIGVTSIEPLSGPRTIGGASSQSVGGFLQTVSSPFGLWRFRFSFHAMKGSAFRRYRGWVTGLHGGANATRWHFYDPDMLRPAEIGLNVASYLDWPSLQAVNWSNGMPWSNGEGWQTTPPVVSVAASAAKGDTNILLAGDEWGHDLGTGDYLGFFPAHFGLYTITEAQGDGAYRIWPPLRKALTTDDFATLLPTLAMRLESEESTSAGRGLVVADSTQVTMVEVLHDDVEDYFAE